MCSLRQFTCQSEWVHKLRYWAGFSRLYPSIEVGCVQFLNNGVHYLKFNPMGEQRVNGRYSPLFTLVDYAPIRHAGVNHSNVARTGCEPPSANVNSKIDVQKPCQLAGRETKKPSEIMNFQTAWRSTMCFRFSYRRISFARSASRFLISARIAGSASNW